MFWKVIDRFRCLMQQPRKGSDMRLHKRAWSAVAVSLQLIRFFLIVASAAGYSALAGNAKEDSVSTALHLYIQTNKSPRTGILFGRLVSIDSVAEIWTVGAIAGNSDLRLGCPFAKPCLAYIVLREGLDLGSTIDRWFPESSGFTKSGSITINHLLLNSSGIRDYVPLIPVHPDSVVTPASSIERAYRHKALLFEPGTGFEYSNTNFNMVGLILERCTGKSIAQLFDKYFGTIGPSLRLDDGKGNYPEGYLRPWPYHWSAPGFAGGFVGTAEDAMRVFAYIAAQPEFRTMTRWYLPDGTIARETTDNLLGLGLFGKKHFAGQGEAVVYEGNMGPCQMILARVGGCICYIASSAEVDPPKLSQLFQRLIAVSMRPRR